MARILLLLTIGVVLWAVLRGFFRSQARDGRPAEAQVEDMVACSLCGVNMPRSESKAEGGKVTCKDPATCRHAP